MKPQKLSRQETPSSVCEVWRCSSRKSRDLDTLGSREVTVVMKVEIVVMVAAVVRESECE